MPRVVLVLEPDESEQSRIRAAVQEWGDSYHLRCWWTPEEFRAEVTPFLVRAALMILPDDYKSARWLSDLEPVCPVVSPLADILKAGGWPVLEHLTQPREIIAGVERMRRCLTGLAIGDSLGEMLSHGASSAPQRLAHPELANQTFYHTDDTEMAIALCSILRSHGQVHQDALAARFVRRYQLDPDRGYGKMTRLQLRDLADGASWRTLSYGAFQGQGSMGNGSAMRVAPLGAFYAEDLDLCVREARASSEVTHTHPEAIAGCIAVAVAAALASKSSRLQLADVIEYVPESDVRRRLQKAADFTGSHLEAAKLLGNGFQVTAQDTVPFCLWVAANNLDFVEAIGQAIQADGDCDTCAAITGSLMALIVPETVPVGWAKQLERSVQDWHPRL